MMPNIDIKSGKAIDLRQQGSDLFVDNLSTFNLDFGNNSISNTTSTRYLGISGDPATNTASTAQAQGICDADFEVVSLTVYHGFPRGNGEDIVYTLQKNGVDTSLSLTLASTDSFVQSSILASPIQYNRGDTYSLKVSKALDIGTTPARVFASATARTT